MRSINPSEHEIQIKNCKNHNFLFSHDKYPDERKNEVPEFYIDFLKYELATRSKKIKKDIKEFFKEEKNEIS